MDEKQLQDYVKQVSLQYFKRPFVHQAYFNRRLKTTGGRYRLADHNLEFNPKMGDLPEFLGIVKHELVHYHLHLNHQGYRHGDSDFKELLTRVKGSRYAPDIGLRQCRPKVLTYCCEQGHLIKRQRRINTNRYVCGRCGQPLQLITVKK
ncbi:SprT family protein [Convivina praedatoris]|uniref:Protein SprT-like protein n=1 Tax=Convivina praedatoris TaxID=2880963 RepID=A0ABM9D288_9LACO|nr:SprT family protein [Convivina sp. LMG 32447]CAH1850417.1 Protein SprT-like protein [Convivina sp. LMG 32447]CAH1850774.1 Protein SprT-like protein [Convivina sp. LMG 32447]CAH1850790.1 Protein SprT-like protein [Convivina sp. LMG 32447]